MALNRFLRKAVKHRMGVEFLIENAVSDITMHIMQQIKKEGYDKYLPNDRRPIKAWGLAMASLRCLKRDLVKNRNKQIGQQHNLTSSAFGLSQVEVVTTTPVSVDHHHHHHHHQQLDANNTTNTTTPIVVTTVKSSGRRGAATIRELELNSRRLL